MIFGCMHGGLYWNELAENRETNIVAGDVFIIVLINIFFLYRMAMRVAVFIFNVHLNLHEWSWEQLLVVSASSHNLTFYYLTMDGGRSIQTEY